MQVALIPRGRLEIIVRPPGLRLHEADRWQWLKIGVREEGAVDGCKGQERGTERRMEGRI